MENLIRLLNIDLKRFSPELRDFIYSEVAEDRLPLGEIFDLAQQRDDDKVAMDNLMDELKIKAGEEIPMIRPFLKLLR